MRSRSRGGILWTLRSSPTLRKSLASFPLSLDARPRTSALAFPPAFGWALSVLTADRPPRVTLELERTSDVRATVVPTRSVPLLRMVPALEPAAELRLVEDPVRTWEVPVLLLVEEPVRTWEVPVVLLVEEPVRTWEVPVLLLVEEPVRTWEVPVLLLVEVEPVRTCGLLVEPELRTWEVPVLLLEEEEPVRTCGLRLEPELRTVLVPELLLEEELLRTELEPVLLLAEELLLTDDDEDELLLTCDPLLEEE